MPSESSVDGESGASGEGRGLQNRAAGVDTQPRCLWVAAARGTRAGISGKPSGWVTGSHQAESSVARHTQLLAETGRCSPGSHKPWRQVRVLGLRVDYVNLPTEKQMSEQSYYVSAHTYEEPTYGVCQSGGVTWSTTVVCKGMNALNETLARLGRERGPDVRFVVCPLGEPLKLYTHDGEVPQPPKPVRIVSADPVDFGKRVAALSIPKGKQ